jgi:hypothetical protein
MNEITLGRWHIKREGEKLTISDRSGQKEPQIATFDIVVDDVNALIVALLATNPGPNPLLISNGAIADRFDRSTTAVRNWFEKGYVPGLVITEDTSQERHAMPKDLIDYIKVPRPGNPAFATMNES